MARAASCLGRFGVVAQFSALALVWGASFLFIKVGLEGLAPLQVVWARMVFGALALGVVVLVARRPVPRDPRLWGHLTVVAVLLCVVPFSLFAWAEQEISSGLASIYNATTPLTTMAFATAALSAERLTRDRGIGLGFGFAGVLVIIGPWSAGSVAGGLLPQLGCLGATTSYGLAFVHLRRHVSGRGVPAVTVAFIQVTVGAVLMVLCTPLVTASPVRFTPPVVVSMVALGALSTGLAYVWNTNVVEAWGAANAAAVTYLTPVVGVVLGVVVLGEAVTWNQPTGALLVIAGILAAHGRLRPGRVVGGMAGSSLRSRVTVDALAVEGQDARAHGEGGQREAQREEEVGRVGGRSARAGPGWGAGGARGRRNRDGGLRR